MRKLKFHEEKLLKKTDFYSWKSDASHRVSKLLAKYYIQDPADISAYDKLTGHVKKIVAKLKILKPEDEFRIKQTKLLLKKLHRMGIIKEEDSLASCDKVSTSSFARRRLAYLMHKNKYCESTKEAVKFIEQGQVKVGVDMVTDPAFHVSKCFFN